MAGRLKVALLCGWAFCAAAKGCGPAGVGDVGGADQGSAEEFLLATSLAALCVLCWGWLSA
jgi:hypothetical protein